MDHHIYNQISMNAQIMTTNIIDNFKKGDNYTNIDDLHADDLKDVCFALDNFGYDYNIFPTHDMENVIYVTKRPAYI